jgi:hypothetical protein
MPHKDPEKARAYDRAYRVAHREERNARNRTYMREYRATHSEEINSRRRANRKECRTYDRAYKAAHPEYPHLGNARRRAKGAGVPCTLTLADVRAILAPMRCSATGLPLGRGVGVLGPLSPTLDRIEPARGYVPGNVRLVCHRFNALRGTDPVSQDYRHALRVLAETDYTGGRIGEH